MFIDENESMFRNVSIKFPIDKKNKIKQTKIRETNSLRKGNRYSTYRPFSQPSKSNQSAWSINFTEKSNLSTSRI